MQGAGVPRGPTRAQRGVGQRNVNAAVCRVPRLAVRFAHKLHACVPAANGAESLTDISAPLFAALPGAP